jgi:hypothetical protein
MKDVRLPSVVSYGAKLTCTVGDKSEGSCEAEKLSTGFDGETCIDGGNNEESC